jgi:hypothetical protein
MSLLLIDTVFDTSFFICELVNFLFLINKA